MQFGAWRRASCILGMFRFKFKEIDGIRKACLKTYMRQQWSRQVIVNHHTSTYCQHLGSSRFFYGIHVAHLFGFQYCVFCFVLLVLVLCIYLQNICLHCSIVLLLAYILMIGLYMYTNNIQWYSHISQAC